MRPRVSLSPLPLLAWTDPPGQVPLSPRMGLIAIVLQRNQRQIHDAQDELRDPRTGAAQNALVEDARWTSPPRLYRPGVDTARGAGCFTYRSIHATISARVCDTDSRAR